jgi:hypothetical protein
VAVIAMALSTGAGCASILGLGDPTIDGSDGGPDATAEGASPDGPAGDTGHTGDADGSPVDAKSDASTADATMDGTSSDAPSATDAPVKPDAPSDASTIVYVSPDAFAPNTVVDISSGGATGLAQQIHVVYAQNDHRWWFFYIDGDITTVKTLVSSDGVNWSPGDTLSLAGGADGGNGENPANFSVAYGHLSGVDVVHLVVSEPSGDTGSSFDIRFTLTGTPGQEAITSPTMTDVYPGQGAQAPGYCDTDGPAVVIGSDGYVYVSTGWWYDASYGTHCDMNVFRSSVADTGGSWSPSFTHTAYIVTVPGITTSHELIALQGSSTVVGAWADQQNYGADTNSDWGAVAWASGVTGYTGGAGTFANQYLFWDGGTAGAMSDDWMMCRLTDTQIYAYRHVLDQAASPTTATAFQAAMYNGSSWQTESPPAPLTSPLNQGAVLISDATPSDGMLAFVVGTNGTSIDVAHWTSTGGWSSWSSIPRQGTITGLTGSGCGSATPLLFWTEFTSTFHVMEADVTSLLK